MADDRYLCEIFRHGIKGMRWGVRRSHEQLGNVIGSKQGVEKKLIKVIQ